MIRSAVTVSLVEEARSGPFVFHGDLTQACKKAVHFGFDAVEIFPPGPEAIDPARLRILLNDHGLALAAVGTGAGWLRHKLNLTLPDISARVKARDYIKSIIDFAAAFRAPAIVGSMQGRSSADVVHPTALGYLADALEVLGEHARPQGVPLLFEPLNRYETDLINTLEAGMRLIRSLSTTNILLLADLFHMNIEEVDIAESLTIAGPMVGHVHFVDSNRRAAGLGHLDFRPIVRSLIERDFDGFVSAEAFPLPDSSTAALQTMEAFRLYFREGSTPAKL